MGGRRLDGRLVGDHPDAGACRRSLRKPFPACHLRLALDRTVRVGGDTDTVAAIAGGLLGARWGASAVPGQWRRLLHGWPGLRSRDLIRLALVTACGGQADDAARSAELDLDSW
jgi:ADP-ribosyl-[dinitrogen reductase] hydrolase